VVGTTHRRIHGENRQGHYPGGPRSSRRSPRSYGTDRVFAYLRLSKEIARWLAGRRSEPRSKRQATPWCGSLSLGNKYNLGQEFFRWEIATAVAGSITRDQRFQSAGRGSQQDRNASKLTDPNTKRTVQTARGERHPLKKLGIKLFTDEKNTAALKKAGGNGRSLADVSARAPVAD
jgi:transaldolase / glucose-6-phosphate isomerase